MNIEKTVDQIAQALETLSQIPDKFSDKVGDLTENDHDAMDEAYEILDRLHQKLVSKFLVD